MAVYWSLHQQQAPCAVIYEQRYCAVSNVVTINCIIICMTLCVPILSLWWHGFLCNRRGYFTPCACARCNWWPLTHIIAKQGYICSPVYSCLDLFSQGVWLLKQIRIRLIGLWTVMDAATDVCSSLVSTRNRVVATQIMKKFAGLCFHWQSTDFLLPDFLPLSWPRPDGQKLWLRNNLHNGCATGRPVVQRVDHPYGTAIFTSSHLSDNFTDWLDSYGVDLPCRILGVMLPFSSYCYLWSLVTLSLLSSLSTSFLTIQSLAP